MLISPSRVHFGIRVVLDGVVRECVGERFKGAERRLLFASLPEEMAHGYAWYRSIAAVMLRGKLSRV